jgi:hypothetical protein
VPRASSTASKKRTITAIVDAYLLARVERDGRYDAVAKKWACTSKRYTAPCTALDQVRKVLRQIAALGGDLVTLGQYLSPSRTHHLPVTRYVHPDELPQLRNEAQAMGFLHVEAGPTVRSSYRADEQARLLR